MNSNATNSTTNYGLPKFIATDKPAWLVDWNNTMDELDTLIAGVAGNIETAQTAIETISAALQTLEGVVGDASDGLVKDVADLQTVVGDANSGLVKDMTQVKADLLTQNGLITSLDQRVTALENA